MSILVFQLGEGKEIEFDLSSAVVTLGRAGDNDIVIDNAWISSHHARFERAGDAVEVIDLDSHNGILLNEQRVMTAILKAGDVVTFGQLQAIFREAPPASVVSQVQPSLRPAAAIVPRVPSPRAAEPLDQAEAGAEMGGSRRQATTPVASGPRAAGPLVPQPARAQPVPAIPPPPAGPFPVPTPSPADPQTAPAIDGPPVSATEPAPVSTPPPIAAGAHEATPPQIVGLNWETVHHFAKALIKRLDLLDDLLANLGERDPGTAAQLRPLRASLIELLREFSVEAYTVELGKTLDVATRKKIHIVEPATDPEGLTEITEILRAGYVCQNGPGSTPTVLRKAEVRTRRPGAMPLTKA